MAQIALRVGLGVAVVGIFATFGCGSGEGTSKFGGEGGTAGSAAGGKGGSVINPAGGAGGSSAGGAGGFPIGPDGYPIGFEHADIGAWKLGEPAPEGAGGARGGGSGGTGLGCGSTLLGLVRDFKDGKNGGHPDFETFTGNGLQGIVESQLGSDRKPVYAHPGASTYNTGPDQFRQWYRSVPDVNKPHFLHLFLQQQGGGAYTFESNAFFPLDGAGWGDEGNPHNYHFTTEVHTQFAYKGGETFRFEGDDDLWVFINGRLAIDLGGLHPMQEDQISLDAEAGNLGISIGNTYPLELFHAERHTEHSNFRVDTNLEFVDCGGIVPEPR